MTRTVSAVPCGKDRHGDPITTRYTYVIDRAPEDWGDNRSRIFVQNKTFKDSNGQFMFTPVVVRTDSIEATKVTREQAAAEAAMEKVGAALDAYFRGGSPYDALAAIAKARGEYEGTK